MNDGEHEANHGPARSHPDRDDEILGIMHAWRLRTLNTVLTVVAVLGSASIISLFFSATGDRGQLPALLIFLAAYLLILVLAFYRRPDWRIRGWGFLLLAYLVGILSFFRGGLAGAGREYLMIIPILATILIGVRPGMATAILSVLIMLAFAFIADAGFLQGTLIYQQNPVDLASWVQEIAYTSVLIGVGTSLLILFNRYLLRMLAVERQTSQDLEHARARLEEYSQTLEDKVGQRTAELAQALEVVEQDRQRMEKELALAGSIQASFMSRELPQVSGWEWAASLIPARQTSGDFYDICPLSKDRYGILVADVVDKGVGAALFMALCWALVHTYASQHPDRPDLVVQKVNQRLFRDTHTGQFVTLFYGVLDARKGVMSYCNAGHNPPYLFGSGPASSVQSMERTGVPLGIFQEVSWKTCTTRFSPGDLLVLYTDGVTEAENGHHQFFGSNRLVSVVTENLRRSPQDIREAIIREVSEFAGGQSQGDDITLMVVARGPEPGGVSDGGPSVPRLAK